MTRASRKRLWIGVSLALLVGLLTGCQTLGYYKQAVQGQFQIWSRQEPIQALIDHPQTPPELKAKLQLVLRLRAFAERELKLPVNGHYQKYADLGRRFVVWNVHAAPELSLEPKRWWYPFVGRLKYRGYFYEPYARKYATILDKKGYDVYVGGVEAYSTLGWFHDPVLNTFLHHDEPELAEILFHELAHQRVFAGGDTDFNEAFATTVAQAAVHRWFTATGNTNAYHAYLTALRRDEQFVELVLSTRDQLKALYGEEEINGEPRPQSAPKLPPPTQREEKARILAGMQARYQELKKEWGGYHGYDAWFAKPVNNAQLNTIATYHRLVPAFQRLMDSQGGKLEAFYEAAEALAKMSKEKRKQKLEFLLQARSPAGWAQNG